MILIYEDRAGHGDDEERHGRLGGRVRRDEGHRQAEAAVPRPRVRRHLREHAVGDRAAAGRHRPRPQRQDGGGAQHGRRGAARARRRARLGRGARAVRDDRSRNADGRDHHGARAVHDRRVLSERRAGGRDPRRRTPPARRCGACPCRRT